jgi:hypothetical protein
MALGRVSAYHPGMAQILGIDARVTGPIEPYSLMVWAMPDGRPTFGRPNLYRAHPTPPTPFPDADWQNAIDKAGKIADRWNIPVVYVVKTDARRP